MTYEASHPTRLDEIRFMVADTTEPHVVPDETIDALLDTEADWRLAAASVAEHVAVALESRVTGFTAPGDLAVQWGDRAKSLRALAVRLRTEVAAQAAAAGSRAITSVQLVRADAGMATVEYSRRRVRGAYRW